MKNKVYKFENVGHSDLILGAFCPSTKAYLSNKRLFDKPYRQERQIKEKGEKLLPLKQECLSIETHLLANTSCK